MAEQQHNVLIGLGEDHGGKISDGVPSGSGIPFVKIWDLDQPSPEGGYNIICRHELYQGLHVNKVPCLMLDLALPFTLKKWQDGNSHYEHSVQNGSNTALPFINFVHNGDADRSIPTVLLGFRDSHISEQLGVTICRWR